MGWYTFIHDREYQVLEHCWNLWYVFQRDWASPKIWMRDRIMSLKWLSVPLYKMCCPVSLQISGAYGHPLIQYCQVWYPHGWIHACAVLLTKYLSVSHFQCLEPAATWSHRPGEVVGIEGTAFEVHCLRSCHRGGAWGSYDCGGKQNLAVGRSTYVHSMWAIAEVKLLGLVLCVQVQCCCK